MKKSNHKLIGFRSLRAESHNSDKSGQTPISPRYIKYFQNEDSKIIHGVTDVVLRKSRRNHIIDEFQQKYIRRGSQNRNSVFGIIVFEKSYGSISTFINSFKKKLHRSSKSVLGYVWLRDIGDKVFLKHFHVLIATSKINLAEFHELFKNKNHDQYNLEYIRTQKGLTNYLKKKELYGLNKQRTFGKSNIFKSIT